MKFTRVGYKNELSCESATAELGFRGVMAKFNVVQKRRRAAIADRKRATKGEPFTGKLKIKPQPHSISGKRKRKLFKKWRKDQKEAVENGLVTMQDVEMAVAQGKATSKDASKHPSQFHVKKDLKLKAKQLKKKGKSKQKSLKTAMETPVDAMID